MDRRLDAQAFEATDQPAGQLVAVPSLEIVAAQFGIMGAVPQDIVDDPQQATRARFRPRRAANRRYCAAR